MPFRLPFRAAIGVLLAVALAAFAFPTQGIQRNEGWITDGAGLLSPAKEAEFEALMESYRVGSGREIALLTVKSLGGRSIEDIALRTAREWGIGDERTSAGALLVVAKDDRRMRIEVGRGLEGEVTDLIAGRITRDVITPRFREGDFEGGIEAGIRALHAAAGGDYGPIDAARGRGGMEAEGIATLLFVAFFLFLMFRGHRRGPGLGGGVFRRGGPFVFVGGSGLGGGGGGGGGFGGFGGGGGFSGGGASGGW